MSRKTMDFGDNLDRYIDLAVKHGGYKTEAEYLRCLVPAKGSSSSYDLSPYYLGLRLMRTM